MSKMPEGDELKARIKEVTGVTVDVLYENPTILGGFSLESFGLMGSYILFRSGDKVIAAPVPFGFPLVDTAKAA